MKKSILFVIVFAVTLLSVQVSFGQIGFPLSYYAEKEILNAQRYASYARSTIESDIALRGYAGPLSSYGGYYPGVYGAGGGNGRIFRDVIAGTTGAAIGGSVGGGKGALVGAAIGVGAAEAIGALVNRRNGDARGGVFEISNQTKFQVEVHKYAKKGKGFKDEYIGLVAPNQILPVESPASGETFFGLALIPNTNGGINAERIAPKASPSGWIFAEPEEASAQN